MGFVQNIRLAGMYRWDRDLTFEVFWSVWVVDWVMRELCVVFVGEDGGRQGKRRATNETSVHMEWVMRN